ncbi:MAG: TlpA family protein disulfide reductase [Candidatus Rokuibacteriota bacterium]
MRSWAHATLLGGTPRTTLLRAAAAVLILGAVVWALPIRRAGDEGGHHAVHPVTDPFERAGVIELTEGQRGPAFRLETLDGGHASLEDFGDKLVVLNFWATWCQPCTLEMPTLEALWREGKERGLVVVGISVDRGAPRPLIDPYVRNLGLTFPILLDPDMKTAGAWRVAGLPATFVIRPGGEVAGYAIGAREWDSVEMRELLTSLLPGAHRH